MPASKPLMSTQATATGATRPASPHRVPWKQRDDVEVVTGCLEGDEVAWRELVTRYSRLVLSIARRYRLDTQAGEDVYQEVFAIIVRQLPKIQRHSGLPKWFVTTTHRVCRQWYDRVDRAANLPTALLESTLPPPDLVLQWERQHVVRQSLRRLGGRCQELLTALYTDQGPVSYDEVARKLGIPEGSIGPTRARCLAKLMELIESVDGDDS